MILKKGRLYLFQHLNHCKDIDQFILVKLFGRFGYIPFTLRFAEKVFFRETKSRYSRLLVNYCECQGIETYTVEEAARYAQNHLGHVPLRTDYFLCLEENSSFWANLMPKGRVLAHKADRNEFKGIVFLYPLYNRDNFLHPNYRNHTNTKVMRVISDFLDQDVCFKPHPKNRALVEQFIPRHRLVDGKAEDLIKRYEKVYCFSKCSIRKDCEMLGVTPTLVDE